MVKNSLEYERRYREENRDKVRRRNWRYFSKLKEEALSHYSNGTLACVQCGFVDVRALSIDHIKDNGLEERKRLGIHAGWHFYLWLRRWGYPEGYQVLCMNCQFIKELDKRKNRRYNN